MQLTVPWIIALVSGLGFAAVVLLWALRRPSQAVKPLPSEWLLSARPVFSTDERRVYRLLREALPHHVILSKLPLVRFCQPTEAKQVRYWFDLLGSIHVTFAICSPNGRVLAAVDLDSDRNTGASRSMQIKQSVLGACRVRYLRCPIDNLPSAAELQLLVPFSSSARGPQPAPAPQKKPVMPRPSINSATPRRTSRENLWQDSAVFHDSFFAPDSRYDSLGSGTRGGGRPGFGDSRPFGEPLGAESQYPDEAPNDIVGVVVDSPRYGHR